MNPRVHTVSRITLSEHLLHVRATVALRRLRVRHCLCKFSGGYVVTSNQGCQHHLVNLDVAVVSQLCEVGTKCGEYVSDLLHTVDVGNTPL